MAHWNLGRWSSFLCLFLRLFERQPYLTSSWAFVWYFREHDCNNHCGQCMSVSATHSTTAPLPIPHTILLSPTNALTARLPLPKIHFKSGHCTSHIAAWKGEFSARFFASQWVQQPTQAPHSCPHLQHDAAPPFTPTVRHESSSCKCKACSAGLWVHRRTIWRAT